MVNDHSINNNYHAHILCVGKLEINYFKMFIVGIGTLSLSLLFVSTITDRRVAR